MRRRETWMPGLQATMAALKERREFRAYLRKCSNHIASVACAPANPVRTAQKVIPMTFLQFLDDHFVGLCIPIFLLALFVVDWISAWRGPKK